MSCMRGDAGLGTQVQRAGCGHSLPSGYRRERPASGQAGGGSSSVGPMRPYPATNPRRRSGMGDAVITVSALRKSVWSKRTSAGTIRGLSGWPIEIGCKPALAAIDQQFAPSFIDADAVWHGRNGVISRSTTVDAVGCPSRYRGDCCGVNCVLNSRCTRAVAPPARMLRTAHPHVTDGVTPCH
jgi:hypothetical protein